MKLQVINSPNGKPEYVLLPIAIYASMKTQIEQSIKDAESEYMLFDASDYIANPVALARIQAHLTQSELAELMGVKQAYISKIENQERVSPKVIEKVRVALSQK